MGWVLIKCSNSRWSHQEERLLLPTSVNTKIYFGQSEEYAHLEAQPKKDDCLLTDKQGGGSTFGVLTSVTIKAFPSTAFNTVAVLMATAPGTDSYWDVISRILSQYPSLDELGVSAYTFIVPSFMNAEFNITSLVDGFYGIFILPSLHPSNTSDSLTTAVKQVFADATSAYPGRFVTYTNTTSYSDFWGYYETNNGPLSAGNDGLLGSRLLDGKALTGNLTELAEAYKTASAPGLGPQVFLVSGKGVHNAKPRGGSNAVNPAWRKAYVHSGMDSFTA